ncbi:MAG: hypothetical protein K8T89_05585, partial [Planctomycetes bacterium]|nr:hypothetical protein [Planctomycetota bacterium]
ERSQDAKKPTKFQIVYDQYKEKAIGKAEVNSSIVGQKIVGEMKDGKYQFASDGKLTSADVDFLERHYRKIDSVTVEDKLPKKPVKVKETWDVDRAVTLKAFEEFGDLPPADRDRVMEKGKLLKAYKKDDRQYGVLEFTIEIPFKSGQQYKGAVLQDGSKVTATLTIDCCIDGSILDEQLTIELKMLLNLKVPNATVINEYVELDESRQIEVTK